MEQSLALIVRLLADLFGERILGALFYWLGWPWVKVLTLGKYPRYGWLSGRREATYVQCVGLAVLALGLMTVFGQFGV